MDSVTACSKKQDDSKNSPEIEIVAGVIPAKVSVAQLYICHSECSPDPAQRDGTKSRNLCPKLRFLPAERNRPQTADPPGGK